MSKLGHRIANGTLSAILVALLCFGVLSYGLAFLTLFGHLLSLAIILLAFLRIKRTREEYWPDAMAPLPG